MKKHKVLSVFVIIGVVMLILGLLTTVVGFAAGGRIDGRIVWPDVFRVTDKSHVITEAEDINYAIKGDVTSIDIDISAGDIKIIPNSQNARVEVRNYPKGVLSISENDGKLTINESRKYSYMNHSFSWEVTIYLAGSDFDTIKIDTDLGNIDIGDITAGEINLDLDAGDLSISNSVFSKLECNLDLGQADISDTTVGILSANLDAGDFTFSGDITQKADIENDLGNVELDLNGAENMYYFEYSIDLGNANINNSSSTTIDTDAAYGSPSAPVKIKIKVSAGNIDIKTR